ncbi:hypothetical protein AVEN_222486-1 [Araneus ventricosus]|uniref:Uncharacterized protein n=1 Tax=Araneus ventricosus TaxID=182803 RepID=A0A4Y2Q038_ARAVE|nr:hypothetical protein AVEN_222486-1 [Araneus ventricosus]
MFVGICHSTDRDYCSVFSDEGDVPILSFTTFTSRTVRLSEFYHVHMGSLIADPHATSFRDPGTSGETPLSSPQCYCILLFSEPKTSLSPYPSS